MGERARLPVTGLGIPRCSPRDRVFGVLSHFGGDPQLKHRIANSLAFAAPQKQCRSMATAKLRGTTGGSHRRPVFLLGFHRGGTTFVQRLLNCHGQVTIFGENRAMLSRLRLMHRAWALQARRLDAASYSRFAGFAETFEPWASPVDGDVLLTQMAAFVESLYTVDPVSTVWGFKEIRHGNRPDIAFLRRLFPEAGLILLIREPRELLRSELYVAWSPARSVRLNRYVERFVGSYFRTIDAFTDAAKRWPDKAWIYSYEALRDGAPLTRVFSRIGVSPDGVDRGLVRRVRRARVGSSFSGYQRDVPEAEASAALSQLNKSLASGLLNPRNKTVRQTLEQLYPELTDP